jgi:hypothetical protein
MIVNLQTGQSKCFSFVKFTSLPEGQAAIHGLHSRQVGAKPRNVMVYDIV